MSNKISETVMFLRTARGVATSTMICAAKHRATVPPTFAPVNAAVRGKCKHDKIVKTQQYDHTNHNGDSGTINRHVNVLQITTLPCWLKCNLLARHR